MADPYGGAAHSGRLAYILDKTLFLKQAACQPDTDNSDRGSSSECYCNPGFLELETLGPRTTLAPGKSASHRETWLVRARVSAQDVPNSVGEIFA